VTPLSLNNIQTSAATDEQSLQEQQDRLDRELTWCIEQLRFGLDNKSSTDRQIAEATKVLRILQSASTPVPKKRQVMRTMFGDYRKKMADELKQIDTKLKNDARKIVVKPVSSSEQCKSTFYKKSLSSVTPSASNLCTFHTDSQPGCSGTFTFNFDSASEINNAPSDDKTETVATSDKADEPCELAQQPVAVVTTTTSRTFTATGTEFRFNFGE